MSIDTYRFTLEIFQDDASEDDDLSDSEMLKLDGALAEAFKNMRKSSSKSQEVLEKKKEIKHFKLR